MKIKGNMDKRLSIAQKPMNPKTQPITPFQSTPKKSSTQSTPKKPCTQSTPQISSILPTPQNSSPTKGKKFK